MVGKVIGGHAFSNAADTPTAEHFRPGLWPSCKIRGGGSTFVRSIWDVGQSTDPYSDGVSAHPQS